MEIFRLGNIEVIPNAFFIRDEINAPLCLENSFGNLASILPVFNKEKIQEQMGRHVIFKCKDVKFEVISVTNFGFLEESSDVPWSKIYWKKCKTIKGFSVRILELQDFMFREGKYSLHLCLQEGCATICW